MTGTQTFNIILDGDEFSGDALTHTLAAANTTLTFAVHPNNDSIIIATMETSAGAVQTPATSVVITIPQTELVNRTVDMEVTIVFTIG